MGWWEMAKALYVAKWEYNAFVEGRKDGQSGKDPNYFMALHPDNVHAAYKKGHDLGTHERMTNTQLRVDVQIRG